jgi:hypothetical protein
MSQQLSTWLAIVALLAMCSVARWLLGRLEASVGRFLQETFAAVDPTSAGLIAMESPVEHWPNACPVCSRHRWEIMEGVSHYTFPIPLHDDCGESEYRVLQQRLCILGRAACTGTDVVFVWTDYLAYDVFHDGDGKTSGSIALWGDNETEIAERFMEWLKSELARFGVKR